MLNIIITVQTSLSDNFSPFSLLCFQEGSLDFICRHVGRRACRCRRGTIGGENGFSLLRQLVRLSPSYRYDKRHVWSPECEMIASYRSRPRALLFSLHRVADNIWHTCAHRTPSFIQQRRRRRLDRRAGRSRSGDGGWLCGKDTDPHM